MSDNIILIKCKNPSCNAMLRMAKGQGKVKAACPKCGAKFLADTGPVGSGGAVQPPKQKVKPLPQEHKVKPVTPPTPPAGDRTIHIRRPSHAYTEFDFQGISNTVTDKETYYIFVDNVEVGQLKAEEDIEFKVSSLTSHIVEYKRTALKMPGGKLIIPAGKEDYYCTAFWRKGHSITAVPSPDPFGHAVMTYLMNAYRSEGIYDWMNASNNRTGGVGFRLSSEGLSFFYPVGKSRSLKQWATGEQEKKFTYAELGITQPLPKDYLNIGYLEEFSRIAERQLCRDLHLKVNLGCLCPR